MPIPDLMPAPFIVGVGRSGTTLLRFILDAHPQMAIPPETSFFPHMTPLGPNASRTEVWRVIRASPSWVDFHLEEDAVRTALAAVEPFGAADGLRAFYHLYASRFGKTRWGDKTPMHCLCLDQI